jgi:23S rRNA (pseudouridine1915-N3)-methyltransferase
MKIKLIAVGKIKESYYSSGIADFSKRLQRFCKLELISVKDSTMEREGVAILSKISNEYVVVLDIFGKSMSSFELSEFINKQNKDIVFIIGSSTGLADSVKKRADLKLSLSKFTFLHEMSSLILLEQIYRAYSIIKNTGYHK